MQPSTVEAILQLLEDRDPLVQEPLLARLGGNQELLEATWQAELARSQEPSPVLTALVLRADAEALIEAFAETGEDLEAGIWLLPRLQLPRVDYRRAGTEALDQLARRVGPQPDGARIADFLCHSCGFIGDRTDYDNPLNSFM